MDANGSIDTFVYRTRANDPGRFRLINAFLPIKTPVRVLRTHTLDSKWSPIAGIRYDGLYIITQWSARGNSDTKGNRTKEWNFDLTLKRERDQTTVAAVMMHPNAEELDDYKEYRRIREKHERESAERFAAASTQQALSNAEIQQRRLRPPLRRPGIVRELDSSLSSIDPALETLVVVPPPITRRVSRSEPAFAVPEQSDDEATSGNGGARQTEEHDNPLLNVIRPSVSSQAGYGHEEEQRQQQQYDSAELTGLKAFAFPVERRVSPGGLRKVRKGLGRPE